METWHAIRGRKPRRAPGNPNGLRRPSRGTHCGDGSCRRAAVLRAGHQSWALREDLRVPGFRASTSSASPGVDNGASRLVQELSAGPWAEPGDQAAIESAIERLYLQLDRWRPRREPGCENRDAPPLFTTGARATSSPACSRPLQPNVAHHGPAPLCQGLVEAPDEPDQILPRPCEARQELRRRACKQQRSGHGGERRARPPERGPPRLDARRSRATRPARRTGFRQRHGSLSASRSSRNPPAMVSRRSSGERGSLR